MLPTYNNIWNCKETQLLSVILNRSLWNKLLKLKIIFILQLVKVTVLVSYSHKTEDTSYHMSQDYKVYMVLHFSTLFLVYILWIKREEQKHVNCLLVQNILRFEVQLSLFDWKKNYWSSYDHQWKHNALVKLALNVSLWKNVTKKKPRNKSQLFW